MQQLITATEVNALLPGGASVTQDQVDTIAEGIRLECGWHIAPVITETIKVDSDGTSVLRLPTRKMTGLTSVTDTATGEPILVNPETGWSAAGLLSLGDEGFIPGRSWSSSYRPGFGRFPAGFRAVTVTFSHGYEVCPSDILRYIVSASRSRIIAETLVGRSVTFSPGSSDIFAASTTLDKYRLASEL